MRVRDCLLMAALVVGVASMVKAADDASANVKRDIQYKTTAETNLCIDLYYPASEPDGKYPVVVYTHGGGWAAGNKRGATQGNKGKAVRGLVDKGFCVVSVDYRLCKKGSNVAIRDCVTDAKDAIRYLSKHSEALSVDTDRVFVFGDSAGGQIAQMLLLSEPDAFPGADELAGCPYTIVAGVSWYGPCDFEKTELFNHDGRAKFRDRFGPRVLGQNTDPADKLRLYREVSPINYLKKDSPPLLMIQGDGDTTIPVHHAHYMKKKAEELGAPVDIMIVKNAGHNWRQAKKGVAIEPTRQAIIERTVEFLAGHLVDEPVR